MYLLILHGSFPGSIHHAKTVDELYKECDYITIHVPALDSTKGMIDKHAISLMKDGCSDTEFCKKYSCR